MTHTRYIYDQAEFLRLAMDTTKRLKDFHIVNNDAIVVDFEHEDEFVPDAPNGNIVIAAFTTCWARIKLYGILQKVGRKCLYYDTDSVIYIDDGTLTIPLGDFLGDLTNELMDGEHILEFVSGGPKNYAFRTSSGGVTCKVKGFTLNHQNSQVMNFDAMKELVLKDSCKRLKLPLQTQIVRNRKRISVENKESSKEYGVVYTKRQRLRDNDTIPYGY